jgi:hypothetical protein
VPGVEEDGLHVPVTVPEMTERLAGQFALSSVDGVTIVLRVTFPLKLPIEARIIIELPVPPVLKSAGEVADKEKSGTSTNVTRTFVECEMELVLPVTVTV